MHTHWHTNSRSDAHTAIAKAKERDEARTHTYTLCQCRWLTVDFFLSLSLLCKLIHNPAATSVVIAWLHFAMLYWTTGLGVIRSGGASFGFQTLSETYNEHDITNIRTNIAFSTFIVRWFCVGQIISSEMGIIWNSQLSVYWTNEIMLCWSPLKW